MSSQSLAVPAVTAMPGVIAADSVSAGELAALKAELARQGAELQALRERVERLAQALGEG